MPIARRVSNPQAFVKIRPSLIPPPPPLYVGDKPVFTAQIEEMLTALPRIGHCEDNKSLVLKYVIPNQNRWAKFYGYWVAFWPARGKAKNMPENYARVLAIIVQTAVYERQKDMQPTLRISELDMSLWPALTINWLSKLGKIYTPIPPVLPDGNMLSDTSLWLE